jgi:hypothetical protein
MRSHRTYITCSVRASTFAGTYTPLPPWRKDALAQDTRRLYQLPSSELADLFDPGCSDRCVVTLGALAAIGLLARAATPAETPPAATALADGAAVATSVTVAVLSVDAAAGGVSAGVAAGAKKLIAMAAGVAVGDFTLVPHGVVQAPSEQAGDGYVGLLMDAAEKVPMQPAVPLPMPPGDVRSHVDLLDDTLAGRHTFRYAFAAWPGWQAYWEHIAFVQQHLALHETYSGLFPFSTARDALMTRMFSGAYPLQDRFCKEARAVAAAAGTSLASLSATAKARLCSKYGQHAAAFEALCTGPPIGHPAAHLQNLSSGVAPLP